MNKDYLYYRELYHHGIKGQKWGVRRYQNPDGSLTSEGEEHYGLKNTDVKKYNDIVQKYKQQYDEGPRDELLKNHKSEMNKFIKDLNEDDVLKRNNLQFEISKGSYDLESVKLKNTKTNSSLPDFDQTELADFLSDQKNISKEDIEYILEDKELTEKFDKLEKLDLELDSIQEDPHYGRNMGIDEAINALGPEKMKKINTYLDDKMHLKIESDRIKNNTYKSTYVLATLGGVLGLSIATLFSVLSNK